MCGFGGVRLRVSAEEFGVVTGFPAYSGWKGHRRGCSFLSNVALRRIPGGNPVVWPMATITAVFLLKGNGEDEVQALRTEHGWRCPVDERWLGGLDGHRTPRVGQRCHCGYWIVEVRREPR